MNSITDGLHDVLIHNGFLSDRFEAKLPLLALNLIFRLTEIHPQSYMGGKVPEFPTRPDDDGCLSDT